MTFRTKKKRQGFMGMERLQKKKKGKWRGGQAVLTFLGWKDCTRGFFSDTRTRQRQTGRKGSGNASKEGSGI